MKTVCIYHSVDLDGWMSAAIVKHWFNQQEVPNKREDPINTIDFIGYNYVDDVPDLSKYDKVIMCDISFPAKEMLELNKKMGIDFIWIDHHISAINNVTISHEEFILPNGLRNVKFAACELTWKYFFPNDKMPEIVRLLGRYDCFGHKGTDEERMVLEFQYGARQCITNYEDAYNYLYNCLMQQKLGSIENSIWLNGKAIYAYLCAEAKQIYKKGFPILLLDPTISVEKEKLNRLFICINKERFNPINFGIDYHADGYDGCASFYYANKQWNFSIYNDNKLVDCSEIAKQYGGGGHRGASGFILNTEQFNKLIKES